MKQGLKYIIIILIFQACSRSYHVTNSAPSHYDLKEIKADSLTTVLISPYKAKLDTQMNEVIAYCENDLTKDGIESTLGNFVMDAMTHFLSVNHSEQKEKSIIVINRGGLRRDLPKGNITRGNIFELMPFDNEIVILYLKGPQLLECFNTVASTKKLFVMNASFEINDGKPDYIKTGKDDLNTEKDYWVVTTDYLANGGDNCSFFLNPIKYETTKIKLRDAILSYCEFLSANHQTIKPHLNGQIRISK